MPVFERPWYILRGSPYGYNRQVRHIYHGREMIWFPARYDQDHWPVHLSLSGLSALPATCQTGQAVGTFNAAPVVSGGRLDSSTDSACYVEIDTGLQPIRTISARWCFDDAGGTLTGGSGTLALVTWADGGIVAEGFGRRTSCHVTITANAVQWYVRTVENGGAVTLLSTRTIPGGLRVGIDHLVEVFIEEGRGEVRIDTDSGFTWVDSRIKPIDGERFACWEPYYGGSGKTRVLIGEAWAEGDPYVPPEEPTTPTLIGSAVSRATSSVTTLSATIPNDTQAGDRIIVAAGYLSSSAVLTGTGLTQAGAVARTGLSSALYSTTATESSAGSTVTVTSTVAAPAIVAVWVLRNVGALGTAATASQGSGSTTVTMPAWTPTAGSVPLHIVIQASSTAAASSIVTPATGMAVVSDLASTSAQRIGAALMAATDWSATTPGTTVTQSGTQFVCAYTVPLAV